MTEQDTFISRLRRQRQRAQVSIAQIAATTRVKEELLDGLERNDLSAWPRGLYARAYVRAYAAAIGLDAGDTVDEFCRLFPQGDRRAEPTMREMAAIVVSRSEWRDEVAADADRRRSPPINVLKNPRRLEASLARCTYAVRSLWMRVMAAAAQPIQSTGRAGHKSPHQAARAGPST